MSGKQSPKVDRRSLLKTAAAASALSAARIRAQGDELQDNTNPVIAENKRPGTTDWYNK